MKYNFKKIKLSGVLKILGIGFFIWGSLGAPEIHAMEQDDFDGWDDGSARRAGPPVGYAHPPVGYAHPPVGYAHPSDGLPAAAAPRFMPAAAATSFAQESGEDRQKNIHGALLRAGLAVEVGVRHMTAHFCAGYFRDDSEGQYVLRVDPTIQIKYCFETRTWNLVSDDGIVKVSPLSNETLRFHKQTKFTSTEKSRAIYAALRNAGLESQGHNFGLDEFQCHKYFSDFSLSTQTYPLKSNPSIYVGFSGGQAILSNTARRQIFVSPNFEVGGLRFQIQ